MLPDHEFRRELIETERCRPKTSDMQPSNDQAHGLVEPGLSRALLQRVRKAHELMMITDGRARELLRLTVADSLPEPARLVAPLYIGEPHR